VLKRNDFKTSPGALQHIGLDPDISSICSLHNHMWCCFRRFYQSKACKHKHWKQF